MPISSNLYFYLNRFLVFFWFLLLPCLLLCLFFSIKEINKQYNRNIIFSRLRIIGHYGYVFHNLLFVFVLISCAFNFLFFICTFVDLYLLKYKISYSVIWHITFQNNSAGDAFTNQVTFFFLVVVFGNIFHLVWTLFYLHYNLYCSDSYFGYLWKRYLNRNIRENFRWRRFRRKHPRIYSFLFRWFFSMDNFNKIQKRGEVILIDY